MELTRGEVQDLLAKFTAESATYRDRIKSDAKGVIAQQFRLRSASRHQRDGCRRDR